MKESKFIELLNLYVDNEIDAADAAALEAEVQRNPQRRQTYREYCRIHKACSQLTETFRTSAPAVATLESAKVVAFLPRRRLAVVGYLGGLAAAACVALVFVTWNRTGQQPVAPQISAPQVAAVATVPAVATPERPALQPAFGGLVRESTRPLALFASADRAQLDWMNDIRLQRLSVEQLRFDAKADLQPADYLLRDRQGVSAQAEMTAFRFQK